MLEEIIQASEGHLVFCFNGVGSAFAKKHTQSSVIIAKNGKTVLVDIGNSIPASLASKEIKVTDFDGYYVTHSHGDHVGGMEELLLSGRYVAKKKPVVLITATYQDILWERTLRGGCEHNESGLLRFSDLATPVRPIWIKSLPREMYEAEFMGIHFLIFRTKHIPGFVSQWENAFWSTGLLVEGKVLFTGDTRFDPDLFNELDMRSVETIFHDCQLHNPGAVHASYDELKQLPAELRSKMYLKHFGDNFAQIQPEKDGFLGYAKPWQIYRWPV